MQDGLDLLLLSLKGIIWFLWEAVPIPVTGSQLSL